MQLQFLTGHWMSRGPLISFPRWAPGQIPEDGLEIHLEDPDIGIAFLESSVQCWV